MSRGWAASLSLVVAMGGLTALAPPAQAATSGSGVRTAAIAAVGGGQAGLSTAGTDFWVTFGPNLDDPTYSFAVTGATSTTGQVTWPDGTSSAFSVAANTVTDVAVPDAVKNAVQDSPADGTRPLGIHLVAQAPVTVYGINYGQASSDAYVAIPTPALGTRYRALAYTTTIPGSHLDGGGPGRMQVVASADDTTITVTPASSYGSRTAGVPFQVSLDAGEVYTITADGSSSPPTLAASRARSDRTAPAASSTPSALTHTFRTSAAPRAAAVGAASLYEITGTLVTSDKPVAAYAGVDCGNIGNGACDVESEQMTPTDQWGTSFVAVRFRSESGNDPVRVLADTDDTAVTVDGAVVATIDAGEYWEGTLFDAGGNTGVLITTSHPALVSQFMVNDDYRQGAGTYTGDPSALLIPPYQQYLNGYTLGTPGTSFGFNAVNVVVPTAATASFRLDGSAVAPTEFAPITGTSFSSAQLLVAPGTHNVTASAPFGAFSYGANDYNSYAYPGGSGLTPVASIAEVATDDVTQSGRVNDQVCFPAAVTDTEGRGVAGVRVDLAVTGANDGVTANAVTDENGNAQLCYVGASAGSDTVTLTAGSASTTAQAVFTRTPAPFTVTAAPTRVTAGDGVTITLVDLPPDATGVVTVTDSDGTTLCTIDLDEDETSCTTDVDLAVGAHTVTATYPGDGSYAGSSTTASFTVAPLATAPTVLTDPVDTEAVAGQTATFTAAADGDPVPTVQWETLVNGQWNPIPGATGTSYTTPLLTVADNGTNYRAVFTNIGGTVVTATASVLVVAPAAPSVTLQPVDRFVAGGTSVTLTAEASGTPQPIVYWQLQGPDGVFRSVPNGSSREYTTPALASGRVAVYRAVFANSAGVVVTREVTVGGIAGPVIVRQPQGATVLPGARVTLVAAATGTPTPQVYWQKLDGSVFRAVPGGDDPTYTTTPVPAGEVGVYRAVFTNTGGTVATVRATVVGAVAPRITRQPVGATAAPGTRVTLTAAATGLPAPIVYWQKLDGDVFRSVPGGSSPTYTTPPLTAVDGVYRAVFANEAGAVATRAVTVGVPLELVRHTLWGKITVGAPTVRLPFTVELNKARPTLLVQLVSDATGKVVAGTTLRPGPSGTRFVGEVAFAARNLPSLGQYRWLMRTERGEVLTLGSDLRLNATIGIGARRSGGTVKVIGKTQTYDTASGSYLNWPGRPIAVQRLVNGQWQTLVTVDSDLNGEIDGLVDLPPRTTLRLVTPNTATRFGRTSDPVTV